MEPDLFVGIINLVILILVLIIILRCLKNSQKENFFNTHVNNYLVNTDEEHMDFVLSNVKLGQYKYLTVIHHRSFNYNNKMYYPVGQLSIITDEIVPQQSEFIQKAINDNKSANMCSSHQLFPLDFEEIWNTSVMSEPISETFSIWRVIPPEGAVALTDIIVRGRQKPPLNSITCVPHSDTINIDSSNQIQWSDNNIECHSVGSNFVSCKSNNYKVNTFDLKNSVGTFIIDNESILNVNASTN